MYYRGGILKSFSVSQRVSMNYLRQLKFNILSSLFDSLKISRCVLHCGLVINFSTTCVFHQCVASSDQLSVLLPHKNNRDLFFKF